jgi:hypothetical protein
MQMNAVTRSPSPAADVHQGRPVATVPEGCSGLLR